MKYKKINWEKYISSVTKFYNRAKKDKTKKSPILFTNNGVMFEDDAPDKMFNIYRGDCDFVVTKRDYNKILGLPGIEDCKV
jgi:hypothetical protein